MRKIGRIGDADPINYGGGYIFTAPGRRSPWLEWFEGLETVAPGADADEDLDIEVLVYRVNLGRDANDFLNMYDWVEWDKVARFTGRGVDEYRPANLRTAMDRATAILDAASYYGWHTFDQGLIRLTLGELKKRWRLH